MKNETNKLVAVYGTLRANCSNHGYMTAPGVEFLGEAETTPEFTMTSYGGFPVVKTDGNTSMKIEVYKVTDNSSLAHIYGLEGYTGRRNAPNNWYNTVDVETPYGTAEMFVMSPDKYPNLEVISSGDWLKR